jgi:hypothetical protein
MKELTEYNRNRIKGYFHKYNNMEKLSLRVGDKNKISKIHKIHFFCRGKPKCNSKRYHITTENTIEVTCGLCLKAML